MELLTVPEAAHRTRLSESWWRKAIHSKKIRYVKLGRRVFVPQSSIDRLIEDGVVDPRS